jgi:hypothetical protein
VMIMIMRRDPIQQRDRGERARGYIAITYKNKANNGRRRRRRKRRVHRAQPSEVGSAKRCVSPPVLIQLSNQTRKVQGEEGGEKKNQEVWSCHMCSSLGAFFLSGLCCFCCTIRCSSLLLSVPALCWGGRPIFSVVVSLRSIVSPPSAPLPVPCVQPFLYTAHAAIISLLYSHFCCTQRTHTHMHIHPCPLHVLVLLLLLLLLLLIISAPPPAPPHPPTPATAALPPPTRGSWSPCTRARARARRRWAPGWPAPP